MQNERTIQFWDDFYSVDENHTANNSLDNRDCSMKDNRDDNKNDGKNDKDTSSGTEWIIKPSEVIFEQVLSLLNLNHDDPSTASSSNNNDGSSSGGEAKKILEIGCGTSTLAYDLFTYYCNKKTRIHDSSVTHNNNGTLPPLHIYATDVSEVCIQRMKKKYKQKAKTNNDDKDDNTSSGSTLVYEVLDISKNQEQQQNQPQIDLYNQKYDLILDKGCLDTFAFRTKHRGRNKRYGTKLIQSILNNIYSLLKDTTGVYFIISPRSKFVYVRDYIGFNSPHGGYERKKHTIVATGTDQGQLVQNNNHQKSGGDAAVAKEEEEEEPAQQQVKQKPQQQQQRQQQMIFMYIGRKLSSATFSDDDNNNDDSDNSANNAKTKKSVFVVDQKVPPDDAICPKCGLSFVEYRKGEIIEIKGEAFWIRRWKGHCCHCKGTKKE